MTVALGSRRLAAFATPAGVIGAILTGVAAALAPSLVFLAAAAAGAIAVAVFRPLWLAFVLIVGVCLFDFLVSVGVLPGPTRWLPEVAILLLVARLALLRLAEPVPLRGASRAVDLSILVLLVASGIGIGMGREHPVTTLLGLRSWFILIGLFYLIVNDDGLLRAGGRLWTTFWILMAIQPAPVFAQWYQSECRNCYVDSYYGTLMSTATLAIMGGMAAAAALALYLERGQVRWLAALAPMMVALGLADAKAGFAMAAAAMVVVFGFRLVTQGVFRFTRRLIVAIAVGTALLMAGMEFAARNLGVDVRQLVFNPQALTEYAPFDEGSGQNVNRAYDLGLAWRAATGEGTVWIGAGPGAGSQSALPQYAGSIYQQYAAAVGRSVFWVQGGRLLVELGLLGVIGTLALAGALFLLARRAYACARTSMERAVALTLIGQVVVFLSAHLYQTLHDIPRLALWLSAAVAVGAMRQVRPI